MTLVVIASQNPAKVQAVKNAFQLCFPLPHEKSDSVEFRGFDAKSGFEHPNGPMDTYESAVKRLTIIRRGFPDADFLFSLESGLVNRSGQKIDSFSKHVGIYNFGVVFAESRGYPDFTAHCETMRFPVPAGIADIMESEKVGFGKASDIYFRKKNLKKSDGTIGLLTNNLISRAKFFQDAVVFALSQFKCHREHWR